MAPSVPKATSFSATILSFPPDITRVAPRRSSSINDIQSKSVPSDDQRE
jgi:hypothetical protein